MSDYNMTFDQQNNGPGVVTLKEWIITLLICSIPLVNVIMFFVWAFGKNTNPSKANFFKASLIMAVIWIILWVIFGSALTGLMLMNM